MPTSGPGKIVNIQELSALTARVVITTEATPNYGVGDFIFLANITDAMNRDNGVCKLNGIHILDKDSATAQLDVRIFSQEPTIASATNAPWSITDANAEFEKAGFMITLGERSVTNGGSNTYYKPLHGMTIGNDDTSGNKKSLWIAFIATTVVNFSSVDGLSVVLHREFR